MKLIKMDQSSKQERVDRKRYRELFEEIDVNNDGKIEASELAKRLQSFSGIGNDVSEGMAKVESRSIDLIF